MGNKVVLKKDQADALKRMSEKYTHSEILYMSAQWNRASIPEWDSRLSEISFENLYEALVDGYETQYTKEEKLIEIYRNHQKKLSIQPMWNEGYMDGMKATLRILEVKIKGITDQD